MSDYAHEWTDGQIDQLRKRFGKEYSQAAREMSKKLEDALSDYGRENAERLKALDDTPQAKKEYEDWKRSQAVSQQWMQDMVHQLSESATHANMHAADMINDCLPHVYAENANMSAFALDKRLGYDTGFTLVNEDAVRHLMGLPLQKTGDDQLLREVTWNPDIERMHVQDIRKREVDYPKDMRWNREKFQSAITQGILQGESIPNIVKRTNDIYGRNKASATRAARTATTNAENAGRMNTFERAQRLGIDMEIEWLATLDGRTRSSHRALDGERIQLGEEFSNGLRWPGDPYGPASEIWNCFVGDTKAVPLGELQRSFRRFYDGDAVTVITASGVNFTCTPNHPILTSEGWVAAGLLDDGYDLFVADLGNGLDSSGVKPDIKHVGTSLEAIHELVSMHLGNRACSLGVYFHEDVLARDVDVVTEERALRVNPKTLGLEPIDEIGLELPDTLASSDGPKMEFVGTPMTPPDSLMSGGRKPRALLGSGIRHALEHGLRTVSGRDSGPLEPYVYDVSTDAKVLGESLHALSAVVKLDHVVNVDVHPISTHVYNLQTESGTYLASSSDNRQVYIIAHNCRCRANGRVVGFDGKRGDWADERGQRWSRLPKDMTYEDWKKAKAVSRDESYRNDSKRRDDYWPTRGDAKTQFASPEELAELERVANQYRDELEALAQDAYGYVPGEDAVRRLQEYADKYAAQMAEHEWAKDFDVEALKADVDRMYDKQLDAWDRRKAARREMREMRNRFDDESMRRYEQLRRETERLYDKYNDYFTRIDEAYKKIDAHDSYHRAKRRYDEYAEELEKRRLSRFEALARREQALKKLPEARTRMSRAYDDLSKAQPFAPDVRRKIGDGYADAMLRKVEDAEEKHPEIAGLYKRFSSQLKVIESDRTGTAFYRHADRGIHVNATKDADGSRWQAPYQTTFHEFGHLIDDVGGWGNGRYTSVDGNLAETIKKDWVRFRNQTGKELGVSRNKNGATIGMLKEEVSEAGMLPYAAVSDTIEGCTKISYPLGFGHGTRYHEREGATAKEFFAETCESAMANEESYQQMMRIFPNAVRMVEDMAREMLQ